MAMEGSINSESIFSHSQNNDFWHMYLISSWYSECLNTLTLILNQCGPSINLIVLLSNWILFDKDNHLILFRSSAPPSYNNDPGINSHPRYSWHNFRQIWLIHMQVICLLCWQCYTIHHSLTTLTTTTCFPLLNSVISDLLFWSQSCHSKTLLSVWSECLQVCVWGLFVSIQGSCEGDQEGYKWNAQSSQ